MQYALVGARLGHSYSAAIHRALGAEYELVQCTQGELTQLLARREFNGLNVTIPYKEVVISALDSIDKRASTIGAVNTIVNNNGKLCGYNTDYDGMLYLVQSSGVSIAGSVVAILGSGGTSKTAVQLMRDLGAAETIIVSRTGANNYGNIASRRDINVLINTTPYGMYPDFCEVPIVQCSDFCELKLVIDAVYNPINTALILDARSHNIPACGGINMLVAQAVAAAKLFGYGEGESISKIATDIVAAEQNIVLIGMPSAGKSHLADKLATMLGRKVYDSDSIIANEYGISSGDMIKCYGEQYFRERESIVIKKLMQMRGAVISTGGGAVLNSSNRYHIKANGLVIYVDRCVDKLIAGGNRPLSSGKDSLIAMYNTRHPIYSAMADYKLDNNSNYSVSNIKEFVRWYNEDFSY